MGRRRASRITPRRRAEGTGARVSGFGDPRRKDDPARKLLALQQQQHGNNDPADFERRLPQITTKSFCCGIAFLCLRDRCSLLLLLLLAVLNPVSVDAQCSATATSPRSTPSSAFTIACALRPPRAVECGASS